MMDTKVHANLEIKHMEFKRDDKVIAQLALFKESVNKEIIRLGNWYIKCIQCRNGKLVFLLCGDRLRKIKDEDENIFTPECLQSSVAEFIKNEYAYYYEQYGFVKIDGEFPSGNKFVVATIDGSDVVSCRWDMADKYFNYYNCNGKTNTAKKLHENLQKYVYEKTDFDDYFFMSKALFTYEDKVKGVLDRYLSTVDANIPSVDEIQQKVN